MTSSLLPSLKSIRSATLVCTCALALFGCSSSSESAPNDIQSVTEFPLNITNDSSDILDESSNDVSDSTDIAGESSNDASDSSDIESVTENAPPFTEPSELVIDESNALEIWREVVTVINEEQVNEFFTKATDEINHQRRFSISNTIDDIVFSESFTADPLYQYEQNFGSGELVDLVDGDAYTCAGGGGIQLYINQTFSVGSDSVFTDCAVTNSLSDGVTYSGITGGRNIFRGSIASADFRNFTRVSSNGETTILSGSNSAGNQSFISVDRLDGWIDLDFSQINSEQDFQLSDYNVLRTTIDSETNVGLSSGSPNGISVTFNRYRLENTIEGSFKVFAPWAGAGAGLSVELLLEYSDDVNIDLNDPDLEFPGRDPIQPFNWETGSVTISASDSFMMIRPSATEVGSFELELSNGTTVGPLPWINEFEINR